eukprot:CAMPEP_0171475832 /NCGR_PEP_ID=MMETSP0946-20130122/3229_1 /TAXON_ID=109269 /ORGANISM="Vaucheria litorea, Strain CCMP2940" /LENGTH=260 /DNA_ID=CAMNT_0012005977 /DNA_START=19 /DNA_END=801 /DNA_ORIENTATION=-
MSRLSLLLFVCLVVVAAFVVDALPHEKKAHKKVHSDVKKNHAAKHTKVKKHSTKSHAWEEDEAEAEADAPDSGDEAKVEKPAEEPHKKQAHKKKAAPHLAKKHVQTSHAKPIHRFGIDTEAPKQHDKNELEEENEIHSSAKKSSHKSRAERFAESEKVAKKAKKSIADLDEDADDVISKAYNMMFGDNPRGGDSEDQAEKEAEKGAENEGEDGAAADGEQNEDDKKPSTASGFVDNAVGAVKSFFNLEEDEEKALNNETD